MNIWPRKKGEFKGSIEPPVSIRVSVYGYFAALFIFTFIAAFAVYIDFVVPGLIVLSVAWLIFPALAFFDRIVFDGRRVIRKGFLPAIWATMNGTRSRLKISDIEQVETQALRALKRGHNVLYRYRTSIRGKGVVFAFSSGGGDYRRMAAALFPLLPDNTLDNRSLEIRDYLADPKAVLKEARLVHIPSADVLENTLEEFRKRRIRSGSKHSGSEDDEVSTLRKLGNQLRLSGFLLQASEAFRRAVLLRPTDGWLWLEFGRCLHSLAGSEKDDRLNRRSIAMMRLAERHAGSDASLLMRLGESYYQAGELSRSSSVFQKAISSVGDNFRSARGLAEVALREGKIAHVIHHFWAANRVVETPALRRWSSAEATYFARLNDDDEYMELEISRVNLFEKLEKARGFSLRLAMLGFPLILVGVSSEAYVLADVGWAISLGALVAWIAMLLSRGLLSTRIPFHLIEEDRED